MSDSIVIFYKSADQGTVAVRVPKIEATRAVNLWPWAWSFTKNGFAAQGGNTLASGNGGGIGSPGVSLRPAGQIDAGLSYAADTSLAAVLAG